MEEYEGSYVMEPIKQTPKNVETIIICYEHGLLVETENGSTYMEYVALYPNSMIGMNLGEQIVINNMPQ
jgi:hypothetical protein